MARAAETPEIKKAVKAAPAPVEEKASTKSEVKEEPKKAGRNPSTNMKTILLYINTISFGGAERVMVNLSNHFLEMGYRVLFVTSFRSDKEYELEKGVTRFILDGKTKKSKVTRNVNRILKLRRIIKEERPNVVLTFMAEPNVRGIFATKGLKVKHIISVRNVPEIEYSNIILKLVAKILFPFADGCVFQTEDAKKWFPKRLQKKSVVIPNPVNPVFFQTVRNPQNNLIMTCGRLTEQKNHIMLINAFSIVSKELSDAVMYIYGEGILRERLEKLIINLGLQDKVFLRGKTRDVPNKLSKADLFVLSSKYEGMPNALMEAMAMGVPSISTDCPCGGPKSLIDDGIDGFLVKVDDEKELALTILKVLKENKLKERIGCKAKEKLLEFSPDIVFGEWNKYIDKVITGD